MLKVSVSIAVRGSYVSGYIIHIKLDVSVCILPHEKVSGTAIYE